MDGSQRRMLLIGAGVALVAGCHAVFGLTDYDVGTAGTGTPTATTGTGGGAPACAVPEDCPGTDSTCSSRTCTSNQCGTDTAPQGTPCTESGGRFCDAQGDCVECNHPEECAPGEDCIQNECAALSCGNNIQDNDESDVDCGGSCPGCANGGECGSYADCQSQFCDSNAGSGGGGGVGGAGTAGAGGAGTGPGVCAPCAAFGDCAPAPSTWCDPSTAGGACVDQLTGGQPCDQDLQCTTGHCALWSQVCCDTACDAICEACAASETGGTDGVCGASTSCTDCDTQYGGASQVAEVCSGTQAECVLRLSIAGQSCQQICQAEGGECLSAVNDMPNDSCTPDTEVVTCQQTGYTSVLCTCSQGCGTGPACTGPQVCSGGTCS